MNKLQLITKGLIKENPTFVLLLGMCPTLGTTTSAINVIPAKVRIPSFIVIIASFVTIVQLVMEAYVPDLYNTLGVFIPLIVVNCIILGRAEAFASKHGPFASMLDGLGIGLGFTCSLTLLGTVREILGAGSVFGAKFLPAGMDGILIFVLAPGAFIALGYLLVLFNKFTARLR